jgi:16S rRNA (guanine966-N2)-methyltransferase
MEVGNGVLVCRRWLEMPRIVAGEQKGRKLVSPRGDATRPTGARVRQTLFDILGERVRNGRFLDLYAGSGAIGLEAASRGAARVALVEEDKRAIAALRQNAKRLGLGPERVSIIGRSCAGALGELTRRREQFDVVFLDPPYESDEYQRALQWLGQGALLAPGGAVVAEHFHKRALPEKIAGLGLCRAVRIGDHVLSFYARD